MSDHESDGYHGDSSAASTSSGEIDCEIVDDNSYDEKIDDQSPENSCLGDRFDSSSGSGPVISNYKRNKRRLLVYKGGRPLWKESLIFLITEKGQK